MESKNFQIIDYDADDYSKTEGMKTANVAIGLADGYFWNFLRNVALSI